MLLLFSDRPTSKQRNRISPHSLNRPSRSRKHALPSQHRMSVRPIQRSRERELARNFPRWSSPPPSFLCVSEIRFRPSLHQGCTKRLFPGCVNMGWKNCALLPAVGKQNPTFSPNFTQPGKSLFVQPCRRHRPRGMSASDNRSDVALAAHINLPQ